MQLQCLLNGGRAFFLFIIPNSACTRKPLKTRAELLMCHRSKWITCFVTMRFSSIDVVFLKEKQDQRRRHFAIHR